MDDYDIEDDVVDYKFLHLASGIPKRGDKEFQPDGTSFQKDALHQSRDAMYAALQTVRGHHMKQDLRGVWLPSNGHAVVAHPKGNYFRDVGTPFNIPKRVSGGLILNSLEAVFLVERGSLVLHLDDGRYEDYLYNSTEITGFDYDVLEVLDLAYLYSIAFDGHYSLDQYQVYSYLKRLGYLIQPFRQISKQHVLTKEPQWLVSSIISRLNMPMIIRNVFTKITMGLRSWGILAYPINSSLHYATKHYFNYTSIFQSLKLIPTSKPLETTKTDLKRDPQYKLSFNVWKPTPSFSKKNPPSPDFQICIVNIDRMGPPKLHSILALFNEVNYQSQPKVVPKFKKKNTLPPSKRELRLQRHAERQAKLDEPIQTRNKYLKLRDEKLKFGVRTFIVAIISNGIMNFVTFNEGDFSLTNCPELDEIYSRDHGIMYMEKI
jgi:tRNA-splicing endonuclease subunit Sen54